MSDKQHAVELLERLGPSQLAAVVHLMETMISSEEDGDALRPAEAKAIAEAAEWSMHNETHSPLSRCSQSSALPWPIGKK